MVFLMKIAIVGDKGVGKRKFLENLYDSSLELYDTHGFHNVLTVRNLEDRIVRFQLWIINPENEFYSKRPTYYIGSLGAIIIFDVNRKETFNSVDNWIHEIWRGAGNDIPIVLLGNNNLDEISSIENKIKVNFYIKKLMI